MTIYLRVGRENVVLYDLSITTPRGSALVSKSLFHDLYTSGSDGSYHFAR